MVEIFKTNIHNSESAEIVQSEIRQSLPTARITFDLEDCDKILKIENIEIESGFVIHLLKTLGFQCQLLE